MKPIHTIGIDIGSGAVKSVLFSFDEQGQPTWLAKRCERIRRRDPHACFAAFLANNRIGAIVFAALVLDYWFS